jgi:hypothetical protein
MASSPAGAPHQDRERINPGGHASWVSPVAGSRSSVASVRRAPSLGACSPSGSYPSKHLRAGAREMVSNRSVVPRWRTLAATNSSDRLRHQPLLRLPVAAVPGRPSTALQYVCGSARAPSLARTPGGCTRRALKPSAGGRLRKPGNGSGSSHVRTSSLLDPAAGRSVDDLPALVRRAQVGWWVRDAQCLQWGRTSASLCENRRSRTSARSPGRG